jgi:hypothetical protein
MNELRKIIDQQLDKVIGNRLYEVVKLFYNAIGIVLMTYMQKFTI